MTDSRIKFTCTINPLWPGHDECNFQIKCSFKTVEVNTGLMGKKSTLSFHSEVNIENSCYNSTQLIKTVQLWEPIQIKKTIPGFSTSLIHITWRWFLSSLQHLDLLSFPHQSNACPFVSVLVCLYVNASQITCLIKYAHHPPSPETHEPFGTVQWPFQRPWVPNARFTIIICFWKPGRHKNRWNLSNIKKTLDHVIKHKISTQLSK